MTNVFTKLFLFVALLCSTALVQAQISLDITGPSSIAGQYEVAVAAYGGSGCDLTSVSGPLVFAEDDTAPVEDGCTPFVNGADIDGKIAVIDRGACQFGTKSLNAQNAGAIAVIICTNNADPIFAMAGGDDGGQVTIPCVMISQADCATIRVEIPGATAGFVSPPVPYGDDIVLWGSGTGTGDGEFDGGLGDWTTIDSTCSNGMAIPLWTWSSDSSAPNGSCGGGVASSPTQCNGAMVFESDALDNVDGAGCGAGGGECPAPQYGELWSPVIDASGWDPAIGGLSVKFWQNTRQFGSAYGVGWSTDGGTTWTDKNINIDIPANAADERIERVFLPGAVGSDQLRIRFIYSSNYYYWIVDDVQIVQTPDNDMSVNPFFAIPNYESIPASQVEPIHFLADIQNRSAFALDDVNLNINIVDANGNEAYNADLNYGTIAADSTAENEPFVDSWTPPATPATYTGTYTLTNSSMDPEFNIADNTRSFSFNVTEEESVFSRSAVGEGTGSLGINPALWDPEAPPSYGMGNFFHIVNGTKSTGEQLYCNSITFALNNPQDIIGQSLTLFLYKWADDGDAVAQAGELIQFGFGIYQVAAEVLANEEIRVPISNLFAPEDNVFLEDDTDYIAMVQYAAQPGGAALRLSSSTARDYGAQRFMQRPTTAAEGPGLGVGGARYTTVFGNPMNGDVSTTFDYNTNVFGGNTVPVVKMHISTEPIYTPPPGVSVQYLDDSNLVEVFPNPTSEMIQLDIELVNVAKNAAISITDINGRLLNVQEVDNLQKEVFTYDVSDYTDGTYLVHIKTDNGVKVTKFVVQH